MPSASVPSARRGSATPEEARPGTHLIATGMATGIGSGINPGLRTGLQNGSAEAARRLQLAAVRRVLTGGGPEIVYQPQLSLSRMTVEGYEALARFPDAPFRGTEDWFTGARELGLGSALEVSAVERALARRHERPAGTTIAVNVSPQVLISPALAAVLPRDLSGIEIELTEHEWSTGAGILRRELDRLRGRGARVAIDDVGTAHSGLRRVMDLGPDKLKLDKVLVQGVANSSAKAALVRAVVDLAEQIGATVCAEGVENLDDLEAIADLDVASAQGWAIGMPDSYFAEAEPEAVRAAQDRLVVMLAGRSSRRAVPMPTPSTQQSPVTAPIQLPGPNAQPVVAGVEELLTRLTAVTTLPGLHTLIGGCAAVLGAETLVISVLSADGSTLAPAPTDCPATFALAGHPLVQACLDNRTVVPVYRGRGEAEKDEVLDRLGFAAVLMVPVISRDRVIGLLECYRTDEAPWSRRQIRSARTVAAMLGPVLDGLLTPG